MARENFVDRHLSEPITVLGETTTRGAIIAEMQRDGYSDGAIYHYLRAIENYARHHEGNHDNTHDSTDRHSGAERTL